MINCRPAIGRMMAGIHAVLSLRKVPSLMTIQIQQPVIAFTHDNHSGAIWQNVLHDLAQFMSELLVAYMLACTRFLFGYANGRNDIPHILSYWCRGSAVFIVAALPA